MCSPDVSVQSEETQDEHHNDNQTDEINDAVHLDVLQRYPARHVKISWIVTATLLARLGSNRGQIFLQPNLAHCGNGAVVKN